MNYLPVDDQYPGYSNSRSIRKALIVLFLFAALPVSLFLVYRQQIFFNRASGVARRIVSFSEPSPVNATKLSDQTSPDIAQDSAGVLHAVWRSGVGGSSDVYYARSSDGGETWERETKLNEEPIIDGNISGRPSIAAGDAGLMVVWSSPTGLFHTTSSDGSSWSSPVVTTATVPSFNEVSVNVWTPSACFANCPQMRLFIDEQEVSTNDRGFIEVDSQVPSNTETFVLPQGVTYNDSSAIDIVMEGFNATHRPAFRSVTIAGVETSAGIVDKGSVGEGSAFDCLNTEPLLEGRSMRIGEPGAVRFNHSCPGLAGYANPNQAEPTPISWWIPRVAAHGDKFYVIVVEEFDESSAVALFTTGDEGDSWSKEFVAEGIAVDSPEQISPDLAVSAGIVSAVWVGSDRGEVDYKERPLGAIDWPSRFTIRVPGGEPYEYPRISLSSSHALLSFVSHNGKQLQGAVKGVGSFNVGRINTTDDGISAPYPVVGEESMRVYWVDYRPQPEPNSFGSLYYSDSSDNGASWGGDQLISKSTFSAHETPAVVRESNSVDHLVYSSPPTESSPDTDVFSMSASTSTQLIPPPGSQNRLLVMAKATYDVQENAPQFLIRVRQGSDRWYVGALAGERIVTTVANTSSYKQYEIPVEQEVLPDSEVDIIYYNDTPASSLSIQSIEFLGPASWGATSEVGIYDRGEIGDLRTDWDSISTALDCVDTFAGQELMDTDGALRFNSDCEAPFAEITVVAKADPMTFPGVPEEWPQIKVRVDGKFAEDIHGNGVVTVDTRDYQSFEFSAPWAVYGSTIDVQVLDARNDDECLAGGGCVGDHTKYLYVDYVQYAQNPEKTAPLQPILDLPQHPELPDRGAIIDVGEGDAAFDCQNTYEATLFVDETNEASIVRQTGALRFNSDCELDSEKSDLAVNSVKIYNHPTDHSPANEILPKQMKNYLTVNGVGSKVWFRADLVNLGSATNNTFWGYWLVDGNDFPFLHQALGAGETSVNTYSIVREWTVVAGNHSVDYFVDQLLNEPSQSKIDEKNENNNHLIQPLEFVVDVPTAAPKPDIHVFRGTELPGIHVSGIDIYRSEDPSTHLPENALQDTDLRVGETVYFRVNLENSGQTRTFGFINLWTIPGNIDDIDFHTALQPGERSAEYSVLISSPWTVPEGTSTITFFADSDDRHDELDETNNLVSRTINTGGPLPIVCDLADYTCSPYDLAIKPSDVPCDSPGFSEVCEALRPSEDVCNKPDGICVKAKAQISPITPGSPIFELWVNGSRYMLPRTQDPTLQTPVRQEVDNDSDWVIYEFDYLNNNGDVVPLDEFTSIYIAYINDKYDGSVTNDRNLYIDWVEVGGKRVTAEDALYDVGRHVGDYRVNRGNHDQGRDCKQIIPGRKVMNVEGMLRFNDETCRSSVSLGTVRGRIFLNSVFDSSNQLVSPGSEYTSLDKDLQVRLDYNMGTLERSAGSPYAFAETFTGSQEINLDAPSSYEVRYRVCLNSTDCQSSIETGRIARVDVPTIPGPIYVDPFVNVSWFLTPK